MEQKKIKEYLANFRKVFSEFIKENVSMRIVAYPYIDGAIIVVNLEYGGLSKDEIKSPFTTYNKASSSTHFVNSIQKPTDTSFVIGGKRFAIMKSDKPELWATGSAQRDITVLLHHFISNKAKGGGI